MGVLLMSMGLRDEAAACYQGAIAACPTHSEAHNNLGVLRKVRGTRVVLSSARHAA